MTKIEMMGKAIAAHSSWKIRLRKAASTGKIDVTPATAKADNQCEFGKWLYGSEFSSAERQSEHYCTVKQLHAQFHQEAAKVVELVTAGQMEAANKLMDIGGSFAKSTTALTEAMVKWRESLH